MKINDIQMQLLQQFSCERLINSSENIRYVNNFYSKRGSSLVSYLKNNGYTEDQNGVTAFYFVKGPDGEPWMYFSLKCGSMFDLFDKSEYEKKFYSIKESINKSAALVSVSKREKKMNMYRNLKYMLKNYNEDITKEGDRPILRVSGTYPAVEMVQFCVDDNKKARWNELMKKYNIRFPLGETMFWYIIVEKIIEIRKVIGCQYAYLFAADTSEDETLINYYEDALKFYRPDNKIGISKPIYDFSCVFMCQEISSLLLHKDEFFNVFNLDANEDPV